MGWPETCRFTPRETWQVRSVENIAHPLERCCGIQQATLFDAAFNSGFGKCSLWTKEDKLIRWKTFACLKSVLIPVWFIYCYHVMFGSSSWTNGTTTIIKKTDWDGWWWLPLGDTHHPYRHRPMLILCNHMCKTLRGVQGALFFGWVVVTCRTRLLGGHFEGRNPVYQAPDPQVEPWKSDSKMA